MKVSKGLKALGTLLTLTVLLSSIQAFATPTREEVYRSDKLGLVVYKDGNDANIFWYVPPVKLFEKDGKLNYYKRTKGENLEYYFYIVPHTSDKLRRFLVGEIVGLNTVSQLKPVRVRKFGIRVKQFKTLALSEEVTDYHYLNKPQLIKIPVKKENEEEFEFFLKNEPGIQSLVLLYYDSERMEKYLTMQLSHKEIFNAMNIGISGQYSFTKAEIASKVSSYLSQKYYHVRAKGAIKVPNVINKVIEECFTPMDNKTKKKKPWWSDDDDSDDSDDYFADVGLLDREEAMKKAYLELLSLEQSASFKTSALPVSGIGGVLGEDDDDDDDGDDDDDEWSSGGGSKKKTKKKLVFTFKKELATSDKVFFFQEQRFKDSTEIAALPVYITVNKPNRQRDPEVKFRYTKKDYVVSYKSEMRFPLKSGVTVKDRDQYTIQAVFEYSAKSHYSGYRLKQYRWKPTWPTTAGDFYYRIGDDGPWAPVNARTVIKAEEIRRGEIQFYVDKQAIWNKLPKEYKNGKLLGLIKPVFTYQRFYPRYKVVLTGKHFDFAMPTGYQNPTAPFLRYY